MSRKKNVDKIVVEDLSVMFVQGRVYQLVLIKEHCVEDWRESILKGREEPLAAEVCVWI
jgi:hypothetical protein